MESQAEFTTVCIIENQLISICSFFKTGYVQVHQDKDLPMICLYLPPIIALGSKTFMPPLLEPPEVPLPLPPPIIALGLNMLLPDPLLPLIKYRKYLDNVQKRVYRQICLNKQFKPSQDRSY